MSDSAIKSQACGNGEGDGALSIVTAMLVEEEKKYENKERADKRQEKETKHENKTKHTFFKDIKSAEDYQLDAMCSPSLITS